MSAGVWGGLSVALDLTSFIPFIWAGLFGRARPSRISWSMWSAEYWVLFLSEVTYGSGLASVWIAGGEAAGSTTLATIGWLQYLAGRDRPSRATIAALLAVGRAAPILYAYPGAGALTAIAAWATSRAAFRTGQPPGQDRLRTPCPERLPLPGPSDHGKPVS